MAFGCSTLNGIGKWSLFAALALILILFWQKFNCALHYPVISELFSVFQGILCVDIVFNCQPLEGRSQLYHQA